MLLLLIFVLPSFLLGQSISQKISVKWEDQVEDDIITMSYGFPLDNNQTLVYSDQIHIASGATSKKGRCFEFSLLDKEGQLLKTERDFAKNLAKDFYAGSVFEIDKKYFFGIYGYNAFSPETGYTGQRNKPFKLYTVDADNLKVGEEKIELMLPSGDKQDFKIFENETFSLLNVLSVKRVAKKSWVLVQDIFDDNLNKTITKSVDLPFEDYKFSLVDQLVDDKGNAYVLMDYEDAKFKWNKKIISELIKYLLVSKAGSETFEIIKLDTNDENILLRDLMLTLDNEKLLISGQYLNYNEIPDKKRKVSGFDVFTKAANLLGPISTGEVSFNFNINDRSFSEKVYSKYSSSLLKPATFEKTREKLKKSKKRLSKLTFLSGLQILETKLLDNGELVQISEVNNTYNYMSTGFNAHGFQTDRSNPMFGKILVTVFNKDKTIKWSKSIDRVINQGRYARRPKLIVHDNLLLIPYNDSRTANVMVYEIETGKKRKKNLNLDKGKRLITDMFTKLNANTYSLIQEKGLKHVFGKFIVQ